jgi:hypothetical protein
MGVLSLGLIHINGKAKWKLLEVYPVSAVVIDTSIVKEKGN